MDDIINGNPPILTIFLLVTNLSLYDPLFFNLLLVQSTEINLFLSKAPHKDLF